MSLTPDRLGSDVHNVEGLDVLQSLHQLELKGFDPSLNPSEIRWTLFHKGCSEGLEDVTQMDMSDMVARLLSNGPDKGACTQKDLSV